MSVREPFNWQENLTATIAGLGILLVIIGFLLFGFGGDNDTADALWRGGLLLVAIGVVAWAILLRPWNNFDDLQTPYYTGHDHAHDEHEDEADDHAVAAILDAPAAQMDVALADEAEIEGAEEAVIEDVAAEALEEEVAVAAEPVEIEAAVDEEPETPAPVARGETVEEAVIEDAAAEALEEEVAVAAEPVETEAAVDEEPETLEPVADVTPVNDDPDREDDLQTIDGIGPKSEQALKEYGIKTFAALATYEFHDLERVVKEELNVRLVGSTSTWIRQARLAAAGDDAALAELRSRIKSGYIYDDLTQIAGISEAVQETLHDAKVRSYDEVIAASTEELQSLVEGTDAANIETWPEQAQFLLNEDMDGLEAFKQNL